MAIYDLSEILSFGFPPFKEKIEFTGEYPLFRIIIDRSGDTQVKNAFTPTDFPEPRVSKNENSEITLEYEGMLLEGAV